MRIAHRGGNARRALRTALAAGGVDWLETDVWLHYGRIVARHDASVWRLPLTRDRWRLGLGPLRHLTLDHLLDAVAETPVRLLLDLKGRDPRLPAALVDHLCRRDALTRVALCTQEWAPLDAARALAPSLTVFFSLGREEQLPAYLARLDAGTAPPLISINHRLLTAARVADLRRRGVTLIAWTVNDLARARELIAWGADGITSDLLPLLRRLRAEGDERAAP
jgi:glycerophosphoryl diester phosphodiesterase